MRVENNWLETNIRDRFCNKRSNFKVTVTPYKFKEYSFNGACKRAAINIGKEYKNIFLALSGGLDSTHVFKTFVKYGVNFTPVIVRVKGNIPNSIEIGRALILCKENNIKPKIIEIDEQEYFFTYYDKIYKQANGIGIYSVPQFLVASHACMYGNTVIVTGENPINVYPYLRTDLSISEFDYYIDLLMPRILIPFYMYSLEIVNAIAKYGIDSNLDSDELRIKLYDSKYKPVKNEYTSDIFKTLARNALNLVEKKKKHHRFGTFEEFYDYLEPWRKK